MLEITQSQWPRPSGVRAVISTRHPHGVSKPPYQDLNLATHVGDDANAVAQNRLWLQQHLALPQPVRFLQQVHGIEVLAVDQMPNVGPELGPDLGPDLGPADACTSRTPGIACAILTADCLPVLFASDDGSQVAAAHAGWRGLYAGVLSACLQSMQLSSKRVSAFIGPGISQPYFEVGDEVRQAFLAQSTEAQQAFVANQRGRWQCDLALLAEQALQRHGVQRIFRSPQCSYRDAQLFYSHRRDAGHTGRFASLVWIQ